MAKSPVAKLAEAVLALEEDLRRIDGLARSLANEVTRAGDLLARELENDVKLLARQLSEEAEREAENLARAIRSEYEARIQAEEARAERLGRQNLERAVEAVVEEIIRIAQGAGR